MRAFPFMLGLAMLGAVSLATVGAISTITQTRHNAMAFRLGGVSALARARYDGWPDRSADRPVAVPASAYAGTMSGADGGGPVRTTDR